MNPQFHDEFIALGALFFVEELSGEEWALLQVHLAYCDPCRETFEENQRIYQVAIPAMAASAASEFNQETEESRISLENAEKRLMAELDGISSFNMVTPFNKIKWAIVASLIGAIFLSAAWFTHSAERE